MYLFVCTGNTCRSPMAETLSRSMGHLALSCGLYAHEGSGASSGICGGGASSAGGTCAKSEAASSSLMSEGLARTKLSVRTL